MVIDMYLPFIRLNGDCRSLNGVFQLFMEWWCFVLCKYNKFKQGKYSIFENSIYFYQIFNRGWSFSFLISRVVKIKKMLYRIMFDCKYMYVMFRKYNTFFKQKKKTINFHLNTTHTTSLNFP